MFENIKTPLNNYIEDAHETPKSNHEYPFWVTHYGITYPDYNYHEIRNNSEISCIEYIISGSGTIITNGKSYRVSKGDTYMLLEGNDQNYYSDSNDPFTKIWFNFYGPLSQSIIDIYGLSDTVLFKNTNTFPYIEQIHTIETSTMDTKLIQEETSAVFLRLIQFMATNKQHLTSESNPVDMIRYYIDCNITKNITMADLSDICNYTPQHIIKIFKKHYNITPHQYILESKLKMSLPLLRTSSKSIEEISSYLGFSDPRHFSFQFEKRIGMRPSTYRKNNNPKKQPQGF